MRHVLALLLLLPLALPGALAQGAEPLDARIALSPDEEPRIDAPAGLVRLGNVTPGERYELELAMWQDHTTFEVRMRGFDVDRPRQMVPSLVVPETEYPLFYAFPNERVWDVDGPARVFHVNGSAEDIILRLGIAGPRNVTLVIERDVTPPGYELGPVTGVTPIGFLQNTTTDELALGDLQVRAVGEEEWIQNPTTEYHVIQRFPVQGLDPDTEHEARVVFTDWAGNADTTETYRVRTPPRPEVPAPVVTALEPAPNATLPNGSVTLRASIDISAAPLQAGGITLFLDKRPVTADLRFEEGILSYTPPQPLAPGPHSVSVEATNDMGGRGVARWSFVVEDPSRSETPIPIVVALGALIVAAMRRRAA